ncbi:TetR/AcrR family transcriptional regulator [Nocardia sp. NPDC004278]
MAARVRNRKGEGELLREQILRAGTEQLTELGSTEALTLRGVARAAGIAPASIYRVFSDKAALIQGLIDHEFERLLAVLHQADDTNDSGDALTRLRTLLHTYRQFIAASPNHYRLLMASRDGLPIDEVARGAVGDVFIAALERCEHSGYRLRLDRERTALMLFVTMRGLDALSSPSRVSTSIDPVSEFLDEVLHLVFEPSTTTARPQASITPVPPESPVPATDETADRQPGVF